jgi:alanine racemase
MAIKEPIDLARPARLQINSHALLHNVRCVKQYAPGKKIIAMVKANAYGCGLSSVVSVLEGHVDAFGVACMEEAIEFRQLGHRSDCVLFEGVFAPEEVELLVTHRLECVIHHVEQLHWILATPLSTKIKVWVKVNTGMNRLGFFPGEVEDIVTALKSCPWIDEDIGLMTHLASADELNKSSSLLQVKCFDQIALPKGKITRSIANSAAIISLPDSQADVVRPGIMLYGVSPFPNQVGTELGLIPVMRLVSAVMALHHYPPNTPIGYGGIWQSDKPTTIGVVAIGYGDGYPRHVDASAKAWVNGAIVPVVGRVSMDMLTIDLTRCVDVRLGDEVELWGQHIPVESVAQAASTIGYELLCQVTARVRY